MKKIGLLSDTHGYFHDSVIKFLSTCDEIWHAGDWGSLEVYQALKQMKPLRGVWGNIDGFDIRSELPAIQRFNVEDVNILMTHIGGYPGHYDKSIKSQILEDTPKLFISGHSHILKVIYDKKLNMLHINPGAAGKSGFHHVCTAVSFNISNDRIHDLEVLELER